MRGLSENLQCKNPSFFINWLDPLDLSKRKKLLVMCCICPRGTREGMPLFFFEKSVFVKHTNDNIHMASLKMSRWAKFLAAMKPDIKWMSNMRIS